ncbi:MAG: ferredoxin--NADP reductase [Salinigranum sp.]
MSQHEVAETLPLLSERATVTDVTALDRDRRDEVVAAVDRVLRTVPHEWTALVDGDREYVDWDRLWTNVHRTDVGGETETKLIKLQERYERDFPSLVRIRFDTDDPFEFVPGQYLTIHYRHVPRPYSIASSPNRDEIELCVRRVPGGRLSTQLCGDLGAGETLAVRGPFGSEFVLAPPSNRDLVFLATGTGVAPFKSMIDYVFEEGLDEYDGVPRNVWLFLGASWRDDIPYYEEFSRLAADEENFHFVPTASREEYLTDWTGESTYVQQTLLTYLDREAVDALDAPSLSRIADREPKYDVDARIHPDAVEVYACGINAMVYSLVDVIGEMGVPDRRIRVEGYG